jgi:hypothetical protein
MVVCADSSHFLETFKERFYEAKADSDFGQWEFNLAYA